MALIYEDAPEDPDAKIWRYFDLPKFLSLLYSRNLYFSRGDMFDDPHEGMLPASLTEPFRSAESPHADEALSKMEALSKAARQRIYVSCWTLDDEESELLWYRYASINQGVAIQSSYAALRNALDGHSVSLGKVTYGDIHLTSERDIHPFHLWTTKRREFEADRELRAIIADVDEKGMLTGLPVITLNSTPDEEGRYFAQTGDLSLPAEATPMGVSVEIDIAQLVHRVVFSPRMSPWLCDALRGIMAHYKLTCPVEKSNLYVR